MLMFLDFYQTKMQNIRGILSMGLVPVEYAVDRPQEWWHAIRTALSRHKNLVEENIHLRVQLFVLNTQVQQQQALARENKQLRTLLQSSSRVNLRVKAARLLAVVPDPTVAQVILDKGKFADVYIGQPVIDAYGIMGQVNTVGRLTSRVMLLTDVRSAIPVEDSNNEFRAIVVGRGPGRTLSLINVPETATIKPGDLLITSGLGLRYPAGYPVGIIKKVERDPGKHFAVVYVEPTAHINRSHQVALVWGNRDNSAQEAREILKKLI